MNNAANESVLRFPAMARPAGGIEQRMIGLRPLWRRRLLRFELRQRRAQRIEAWSVGKPVVFDEVPDRLGHCGVLDIGKINCWQSRPLF